MDLFVRRAGVREATIIKIAGWKTPAMFRRYDIQDGRNIQRSAEIMERQLAQSRLERRPTDTAAKPMAWILLLSAGDRRAGETADRADRQL